MHEFSGMQIFAIWLIPVLFGITLHEVAHGWMAKRLGDHTAYMLGRLTINPLKHIDLLGTVLVPILTYISTGYIFGWAKPVPINWRNLKKVNRDIPLVALAGPISNFLMAVFWVIIAKLGLTLANAGFETLLYLFYVGQAGVSINLILGVLNLIPIPPLDGSRVVSTLLPFRLALFYNAIERFGILILILLLYLNILQKLMIPPFIFLQNLLFSLVFLN